MNKKIRTILSQTFIFLVSSFFGNMGYSQVDTLSSNLISSSNENSSHDVLIGFLIFAIVAIQLVTFYSTQKKMSSYKKAIDDQKKYRAIKIRIPVRWAESHDLEKILSRKSTLIINESENRNTGFDENINSEGNFQSPEPYNIQMINDRKSADKGAEMNTIKDLFSQDQEEKISEDNNSWVLIQKYDDGRIQTKRVMKKNIDKYLDLGWDLLS